MKLGVGCGLGLDHLAETLMILFQHHDSILKQTSGLGGDGDSVLAGAVDTVKDSDGGIEEMDHKLQTGVSREVNSILIKLGSSKTWQQVGASRTITQVGGKLREDLRQPLTVPQWRLAIHRGSHDEGDIRPSSASCREGSAELVEHGLDSPGDARILLRGHEKVGDAGQDANVGLLPDLVERLVEQLELPKGQDLAARHQGTGPRVRLRDVLANVGVAYDREDLRLRHDDSRAPEEQSTKNLLSVRSLISVFRLFTFLLTFSYDLVMRQGSYVVSLPTSL